VVGFDRGGRSRLALTDWAMIPVWDIATGRARAVLRGDAEDFCAAFSPDSRSLSAGGLDATLKIWELAASP
jgi:hypothetical protein